MLKIRLQRFGKKNQPTFRMVLVDSQKGPKSGAFLEILGSYDPRTKDVTMKEERILHWISLGAQASDRVHNILVKKGIIKGAKVDVSSKKNIKTSEMIAEEKAAAEAEKKTADEETAEEAPEPAAEEDKKEKEAPAKDSAEEAPQEEVPAEEVKEEVSEPAAEEDKKEEEAPTEEAAPAEEKK